MRHPGGVRARARGVGVRCVCECVDRMRAMEAVGASVLVGWLVGWSVGWFVCWFVGWVFVFGSRIL